MKIIFISIMLALAFGDPAPALALSPPSSATVRCAIVLREWCIADSASSVSMVDLPYRQLWLIKSPIGMQYGPMVIIADKACNESPDLDVSFIGESKKRVSENGEIYEATFKMHKDGCLLKFEWPAGAANSYSYQEFMAFNVFIGKAGADNYIPLYKFYGKTRCHGVFVKSGLECK